MIQILPIGTLVWVAQGEQRKLGRGRPHVVGDGVVTAHLPCSACWQRHVDDGGHVSAAGYRAAADACEEPAGYVASVKGLPLIVAPGDETVLAVPITSTDRSAA
ncbi:hypothetical protein AB0G60_02980 [Streptomyces angustmyceticus]|uniref:Uncharacterized protein n=1 Tax=Streptomyces angustmyceticus TaxID=285578 RepID=A0A5J4L6N3_9ACTN|nr:hypothetical protein [Streptomyces angustmyceticus]UAL65625.1 hypothetical protein K7396_02945 [Streptomyces angustmyceticus]GES27852.1 hypothetical protein San01_03390 [Streptomyces angustmyceticus]